MGFWSSLDEGFGGVLPGGPTPGEVRYRDTYLGKATGGATAATLGTVGAGGATLAAIIPGGLGLSDIPTIYRNAYAIGATGSRTEGGQNVTAAESWRAALAELVPAWVYDFDVGKAQTTPGSQKGNVAPPLDPLTEGSWKWVIAAAIAAFALGDR